MWDQPTSFRRRDAFVSITLALEAGDVSQAPRICWRRPWIGCNAVSPIFARTESPSSSAICVSARSTWCGAKPVPQGILRVHRPRQRTLSESPGNTRM